MTIKLTIHLAEPESYRSIGVQYIEKARTGEINVLPIEVIPPGHSKDVYVHDGLEFRVFEIAPNPEATSR